MQTLSNGVRSYLDRVQSGDVSIAEFEQVIEQGAISPQEVSLYLKAL